MVEYFFDVSLNASNLKMSISAFVFKFDMISFYYVLIIKTRNYKPYVETNQTISFDYVLVHDLRIKYILRVIDE